jgi:hypothetical protein
MESLLFVDGFGTINQRPAGFTPAGRFSFCGASRSRHDTPRSCDAPLMGEHAALDAVPSELGRAALRAAEPLGNFPERRREPALPSQLLNHVGKFELAAAGRQDGRLFHSVFPVVFCGGSERRGTLRKRTGVHDLPK